MLNGRFLAVSLFLLAAGRLVLAQEAGAPGWEFSDARQALTFAGFLAGVPFFVLIFGLWRFITGTLERKRHQIPWVKLRFWWPACMLCWSLLSASLIAIAGLDHGLALGNLLLFSLLNFPVILILISVDNILLAPGPDLSLLVLLVFTWPCALGLVRLAQWRAFSRDPVRLQLNASVHPDRAA